MAYLIIAPIFFASFSLLLRHSQRLGVHLHVVGAANYAAAAFVFGVLALIQGAPPSAPVTALGLVAGVIYVTGYFALTATMRDRGVSLASALMQLSVVIPMLASLVIWREALPLMRAIGAGLCLLAMPLIVLDRGVTSERMTLRRAALFVLMFSLNGLALLCSRIFEGMGMTQALYAFSAVLFGTAAVGGVAAAAVVRARVTAPAVVWGVLLGLANAGAVLTLIMALHHQAGFVVFPVVAASSLALVAIFAAVAWREAPGWVGWGGLGLTVVAAVLANM